jgi:hypothetical protein
MMAALAMLILRKASRWLRSLRASEREKGMPRHLKEDSLSAGSRALVRLKKWKYCLCLPWAVAERVYKSCWEATLAMARRGVT